MRIIELVKSIGNRFPTLVGKNRLIDNLVSKKEIANICDLDLALIIIGLKIHYLDLNINAFLDDKSLLDALIDSKYSSLLAPEFFKDDVFTVDDVQYYKEVTREIVATLSSNRFKKVLIESIDKHILVSEVDIKLFDTTQSKVANNTEVVKIEIKCNKCYSFALSQTRYKLISDIILVNLSDQIIKNAKLVFCSEPGYIEISNISVPLLNPNQPVSITEFDINAHLDTLMNLKEKMIGTLSVKLIVEEKELVALSTEIDYFSYDTLLEFALPGTISLFITPNDNSIKNVIGAVAKEKQKFGSSTLSDYQVGDKNDVVQQLHSLYDVLHNEAIAYITVPPSYKKTGQKIRLPHDVLSNKQGTCLDLSVLFLACVEALGLNGVLVKTTGHAFAGVFLEDTSFSRMIYDDASKAFEMSSQENNEIIFIECTSFVANDPTSFEEACKIGRQKIEHAILDNLFEIVDINRARTFGFLPLPISFDDVNRACVNYEVVKQNNERLARKDYSYKGDRLELTQIELNKFDIWGKKLLDLSRRNQLINYKIFGHGLQLYFYDLSKLFNNIRKSGASFRLIPAEINETIIFELPQTTQDNYIQINNDFENKNLKFIIRNDIQKISLKFFERERKKAFEESGSNVLFLAIGFIQYYESERSSTPSFAPIILVPIDLVKHSQFSYSIKSRGETPLLNISIFEFLSQKFGLKFDDLMLTIDFENDDDEINIDAILNTVGEKILKLERSSILRTTAINVFNFSKAVMWEDLKKRRDELAKNEVIKSIIEGKYTCNEEKLTSSGFDEDKSIDELAVPLPADSSQIVAIKECNNGKSFILQGPPGTGKSQTITNMIVNAIYHGKTVLFVAEKMAALKIVQRRLEQISLDKFALEIHSAKADKASVMQQIENRVKLGATASHKEDYFALANKLKSERQILNRVISLLHKKTEYFISFYDALVQFLDLDSDIPVINIPLNSLNGLSEEKFFENARLCNILFNEITSNGGYYTNPFFLYRNKNYIPINTKRTYLEVVNEFISELKTFINQYKMFNAENHTKYKDNFLVISHLASIIEQEENIDVLIPNLLEIDIQSIDKPIAEIISIGKEYQEKVLAIRKEYDAEIFSFDFETDSSKLKSLNKVSFLKRHFVKSLLLKNVTTFKKGFNKIKLRDLPLIYDSLKEIKQLKNSLEKKVLHFKDIFGESILSDIDSYNFEEFENKYQQTKKLIDDNSKVFSNHDLLDVISRIQNYTLKGKDLFLQEYKRFEIIYKNMEEIGFDFSLCEKNNYGLEEVLNTLELSIDRIDYLQNWCSLLSIVSQIKRNDLEFILDFSLLNSKEQNRYNYELVYKKSILDLIIKQTIKGDTQGSFNSEEMSHHLDYYKELVDKSRALVIKETAARVSAATPSINDNAPASSLQGILNKAIKNSCRGKSIRQLFSEVSDILTKLFPIFLMSPISCTQYLNTSIPKFDITIFDEASQMPTCEAVGAISRGKSLIVVGDSKQMPPTSFFQNKRFDDLDSDIDDQQSILDDCDVIGMPTRSLNWHYRSKHESLIRFSNVKFYDNKLVTFPSPNDLISKISFVNTKGVYGEKKATNEIEARAVIKEIYRRLRDPELSKKSIGVVTFSAVQQDMIDDLLQDLFARHRDLEKINNDSKEQIIVKNLENIQGDERDVILFSICYGPNKKGVIHKQFGPINKVGGERRLNVAISRARYEMVVFASFEPEALSDMKTESRGAIELYNFLKYAKSGSSSLIISNGDVSEARVGIEKKIAHDLKEEGYDCNIDVGKSSFRIDIGVINPDNDKEYILGILCDSYSYESTLTSDDRNIIQPASLELLGWNLMRVWSFDYLDSPKKIIKSICQKIEEIRKNPEKYKKEIISDSKINIEFESREIEKADFSTPYISYNFDHSTRSPREYSKADLINIVKKILDVEAPISETVLRNRFANAINASKAGSIICGELMACLKEIGAKKNRDPRGKKYFYWRANQLESGKIIKLEKYRVGGIKPRNMDDIPKEEILVAIKEVLVNNGAVYKEDLIKYVANAFDIKSVGRIVKLTIESCIDHYIQKEELIMSYNGTRVSMRGI